MWNSIFFNFSDHIYSAHKVYIQYFTGLYLSTFADPRFSKRRFSFGNAQRGTHAQRRTWGSEGKRGRNFGISFEMKLIFRLDRRKRHFQVSLNVNPILFVRPVIEISAKKSPFNITQISYI